jgi:uncharacterized protein involved in exopolysaccharide biosynthesis
MRRAWTVAIVFLTAMALAGFVILFVPGRYDAEATAMIDPSSFDPVTGLGDSQVNSLKQGNVMLLVKSVKVAKDVIKRLGLAQIPQTQKSFQSSSAFGKESIEDWLAPGLLSNVDAKFTFGTNVLTVKYKATEPLMASEVANAFMAATVDAAIAMKASNADQTAQWFAPQLDDLHRQVDAARTALGAYQTKTNMPSPSGGDADATRLLTIASTLSSAQSQLAFLDTRLAQPESELALDPSDHDAQILASLRDKLANSRNVAESNASIYGVKNPKVSIEVAAQEAYRKQIEQIQGNQKKLLEEKREALKSYLVTLETMRDEARKHLVLVQESRDKMAELQRDITTRQEQLDAREKSAAQARLQAKMTFSDMVVLDKATAPVAPSFPKPAVVFPVAFGAGLIAGLLLAMIGEAFDRRLRNIADVKSATSAGALIEVRLDKLGGLTGGGMVRRAVAALKIFGRSRLDSDEEQVVLDVSPLAVAGWGEDAEAFRSIRARLLAEVGVAERVFAVVGPTQGCGSGVVATNLAATFAMAGMRTLLVDANLRSPDVADLLGVAEALKGRSLADLLASGPATVGPLSLAVFASKAIPDIAAQNLFLVAGGHGGVFPEILESKAFEDFSERVRREYDVVVYAVSPALEGADAYMVAAKAGHAIVCVSRHDTTFIEAREVVAGLTAFHCVLSGAVLLQK